MQKKLSYRSIFQRKNLLKKGIFSLVFALASYPRMIIEVILRKNFGERYYSLTTGITVGVLLSVFPLLLKKIGALTFRGGFGEMYYEEYSFWAKYATWYLYIIFFAYCVYLRWKESKREVGNFNFKRFSLYTGDIDNRFYKIEFFGKATARKIEIYYEPALFFIAGILLKFMGQPVGLLFIICSVLYSISYAAAYKEGDDFVLDKIDEIIQNEKLHNAFVGEDTLSNNGGFRWYGERPNTKEGRENLFKSIFEDEDSAVVI